MVMQEEQQACREISRLQKILRPICFLMGLALLLGAASWLYRPRDNTASQHIGGEMAWGFLSEPAESIDVFFIGSSEFYSGVVPMRIWQRSGITSYDLATSAQRIYKTDTFLKKLLRTRHPKVVVLDAYVVLKKTEPSDVIFDLAGNVFPILNYHSNWKHTSLSYFASPVEYTHHELHKGFLPRAQAKTFKVRKWMKATEKRYPLYLVNSLYLEHIRKLCQDAGVELMIVSIPSPLNWSRERSNTLEDYSEGTGIPFLDLNTKTKELGLDYETDFRDNGDHMNHLGARKVSIYLAKYLQEHYSLENHQSDSAYEQWNQDYMEIFHIRPEDEPS